MSQTQIVQLACDLPDCGRSENVDTFTYVDHETGEVQELELCKPHSTRIRRAMADLRSHARPAAWAPQRAVRTAQANGHGNAEARDFATRRTIQARSRAVREWAVAEGIAVQPHGRISADVMARYSAAHPQAE